MGLVEKRIIAEFQEKHQKEVLAKIQAVLPYPVEFTIAWDGITNQMIQYGCTLEGLVGYFESIFVIPIVNVFSEICSNETRLASLRNKMKTIHLCSTDDWKCGVDSFTLKDSIFTVDHSMVNIDKFGENDRTEILTQYMKKNL